MEFSGDRSHSAPFVVTEESMNFWACPWEEVEGTIPPEHLTLSQTIPTATKTKPTAAKSPTRSLLTQWLMWSLMTLAYVGTISIIGYGVYEVVGHWGSKLTQTQTGIAF